MDAHDFAVVVVSVVVLLVVGLLRERGVDIVGKIGAQKLPVRWIVWYAVFLVLLIFGAYGAAYTPVDPMYAQF